MSALTSLLVRDDIVSVRQIEDALQRQVLDGVEIDTALLELDALPENVLIGYRAASERARPASREDVMGANSATRVLLPAELAKSCRVTPLTHDATSLTVATAAPLTPQQLIELVGQTGLRIEWRITTELRVCAALERFYGKPLEPRMAALLARVDALPAGEVPPVEPLQVTPRAALSGELLEGFDESEDFESALEAAFDRVSGAPPDNDADDGHATRPLGSLRSSRRASSPMMPRAQPNARPMRGQETARLGSNLMYAPAPAPQAAPPVAQPQNVVIQAPVVMASRPDRPLGRPATEPTPPRRVATARLPQGPLSGSVAEEALAVADERDAVVEIFFRFARQYFDTTVLLTLKDERALGTQAHNASALVDVRHVSVPILRGGAIDDMVRSLLPRVSDLGRKDEDRVLVLALKRLQQQPAALIPICIKRRMVSFIYGDRRGERFVLDELAELLVLLPHVSRAFERIIHTRKALGLTTGTTGRRRDRDLQHAPTQRSVPIPDLRAAETVDLPPPPAPEPVDARTREALDALGVPRPAPTPPAPRNPNRPLPKPDRLPEIDPDSYATARMSIAPLEADDPDRAPANYLSKPPPGAGRYKSTAPAPGDASGKSRKSSAERVAAPQERPAAERPAQPSAAATERVIAQPSSERLGKGSSAEGGAVEDTQPLRQRRSSTPTRKGRSVPPRKSLPPPLRTPAPIITAGAGRASLHASKPAPGTGSYHRQGVTTEMISMPPGPMTELPQVEKNEKPRPSQRPPANDVAVEATLLQQPSAATQPEAASIENDATAPVNVPEPAPPPKPVEDLDLRKQAEQLLSELCKRRIDEELPGVQALRALGEPALQLLLERFPGPLWFDRRKPHARVPFGRDIGPVTRALDAFGAEAFARFAPQLRAVNAEARYYATLFACDRVHPALLEPLLERLFDEDAQIRLLVRDVLPHYRKLPGFARVAERLGAQAASETAPLHSRLAAIDAIGVLRDAASVPTLIELVTHNDKQISVPAHRALAAITCQDFGKTARKWRAWYEDNAYRHRVEWLIEGLMHSDQALRASAGLELQKLTQVYYGYVAGAAKRDRELAQKRYWDWWRGEGKKKF